MSEGTCACCLMHYHGGSEETPGRLIAYAESLGLTAVRMKETDPSSACRILHFHGDPETAFEKMDTFAQELGLEEIGFSAITQRLLVLAIELVGAGYNEEEDEEGINTASA